MFIIWLLPMPGTAIWHRYIVRLFRLMLTLMVMAVAVLLLVYSPILLLAVYRQLNAADLWPTEFQSRGVMHVHYLAPADAWHSYMA
jgi:hypothetical protein